MATPHPAPTLKQLPDFPRGLRFNEQSGAHMRQSHTLLIAGIFLPAAIAAVALEGYARQTLIPHWCSQSPVCAASRAATSGDPIRIP